MPSTAFGLRQAPPGRLHHGIRLLYSSSRDRWNRISHNRLLHSGSGGVSEGQGKRKAQLEMDGWEPWTKPTYWREKRVSVIYHRRKPTQDEVDDKNILVGNLEATLEAHRTANRLRKYAYRLHVSMPPEPTYCILISSRHENVDVQTDKAEGWNPVIREQTTNVIDSQTNGGNEGIIRHEIERAVSKPILPIADEGESTLHETSRIDPRHTDIRENEGQHCQPHKSWQLTKDTSKHSPWIHGIERTAIPGIERLIWRFINL